MPLTARQKRQLRELAHRLKPVVTVGQHGLRASVLAEIDEALRAHELLKVRIGADDREQRLELIAEIAAATHAEVVQRIGHVAVLFRRNAKKPRVPLTSD